MSDTINREEFLKQFLADTSSVVKVSNETNDKLLEQLHEGISLVGVGISDLKDANREMFDQLRTDVQEVSTILGDNFSELIRISQEYAQAAIDVATNRRTQSSSDDNNKNSLKIADILGGLLSVQQSMFSEFRSQNTMWVGVSKFGQQAENQLANIISNAIQGSVSPTITNANLGGAPSTTIPAVLPNTQAANTIALVNSNTYGPTSATVNTAASSGGGGNNGGQTTTFPNGSGGGGSGGGRNNDIEEMNLAEKFQSLAFAVEMATSKVMGAVNALGIRFETMWEGVIANQAVFQRNMRNMLFTTQGFVKQNREIERSYFDISNAVSATGQKRVDFQKEWMQMVQRGFKLNNKDIKNEKDRFKLRDDSVESTKSVVVSAMATAKQLDLADGSMSNMVDMMGDWAFHLGMSEFQISNMGREMQRIARSTGVTGDRLMNAMKSANKIMESLRSAANFSEKASTNVMAFTVSLEKRGVLDKFGSELEAMTSSWGFLNASGGTRNLLTQIAGATGNQESLGHLLRGESLEGQNAEKLFSGIGPMMERYIGGAAKGLGYDKVTTENLSEVVQKLKNAGVNMDLVDRQIRAMTQGEKGLGDITRLADAAIEFQESTKPVGIQMDNLAKKIRDEEIAGRGMLDATNELRSRFNELQTDSIIRGFSALEAQTREGFGVDELRKRLSDTFGQTPEGQAKVSSFISDPSSFAEPLIKSLRDRAKGVNTSLDSLLDKRGFNTDSLMSGLSAGGEKQIAALRALQEAQSELGTLEKDNSDPINSIQRDLSEINNKLGGWFGSLLGSLSKGNLVGIIVAALVAAAGANILMGGRIFQLLESISGGAGFRAVTGLFRGGSVAGRATGTLANASSVATAARSGQALNLASEAAGIATNPFATMSGTMGQAARSTQAARLGAAGVNVPASAVAGRSMFSTLGKLMGPLTLAIGGLTGALEANEAGVNKQTGAILGVLTGGAKTGSMFSGMMGIEKGSGGDKALGALGGAVWGAAAGAALAPFTAGLSIPIAAAIGAAVGLVAELFKIITEGTNLMDDLVQGVLYVISPAYVMIEAAWYMLQGAWKVLKGLFTLDLGTMVKGLWDILWAVPKAILNMIGGIIKGVLAIPKIIWRGIKMASKAIWDTIANLPQALADVWTYVKESFVEGVHSAFGELWSIVSGIWNQLPTMLMGALKAIFVELPRFLFGLLKSAFFDLPMWLASNLLGALKGIFIDLPMWIGEKLLDTLEAVFITFPKFLGQTIMDGFNNLMSSELLAPIIEPFADVWKEIQNIFNEIKKPFVEAFDVLKQAWSEVVDAFQPIIDIFVDIKTQIFAAFKPLADIFSDIKEWLFGPSENASMFAGAMKAVAQVLGFVVKVALTPLIWALKALGFVIKGVMMIVTPVIETITGLVVLVAEGIKSVIGGIKTGIEGLVQIVKGIFTLDFGMIKDGVVKVFSGFTSALQTMLFGIPMWIGQKFLEGISALPGLFMDGITSVFVDFPTMVLNGFMSALGEVWDWIKSWIPGMDTAQDAAKGFSETNEDAAKRIEKEGSGVVTGLGRTAGGVKDIFTGGEQGGLSGRWEGVKKTAGGAWESAKAVGSALNPLNWFEDGSREITHPGVAVLHEGEMIVPKKVWESIKGSGKSFGGMGGMLESALGFMTNPLGFGKVKTPIEEMDEKTEEVKDVQTELLKELSLKASVTNEILKTSLENKIEEEEKAEAKPQSLGAFASGESTSAMMSATDLETKKMNLGDKLEEASAVKKKSAAREYGEKVSGSIDSVGVVIKPVVEAVAKVLSPVVAKATESLKPMVNAARETLTPFVKTAMDALSPVANSLYQIASPMIDAMKPAISSIDKSVSDAFGYQSESGMFFSDSLNKIKDYFLGTDSFADSTVSTMENVSIPSVSEACCCIDSDMQGGILNGLNKSLDQVLSSERIESMSREAKVQNLGAFSSDQSRIAVKQAVDSMLVDKGLIEKESTKSYGEKASKSLESIGDKLTSESSSAEKRLDSIISHCLASENFKSNQIKAESLGAFAPVQATSATQSALDSQQFTDPFNFSSLGETLKTISGLNLSKYLTENLMSAFSASQSKSEKTSTSMQNLGAFSDKQSVSAIESAISERTSTTTSGFREMVEAIIQNWVAQRVKESETGSEKLHKVVEDKIQGYQSRLESISMQSLGAFSSDQSRSAQMAAESEKLSMMATNNLDSKVDSALTDRISKLASKEIDVGLSRALYTEKEDIPVQTDLDTKLMDAAFGQNWRATGGDGGSGGAGGSGGNVSSNMIGNIEAASAIVNPLLTTRASVEEMLERQRAGESGAAGMATLPDMSAISSYLIGSQSEKLDRMIMLLENIDRNTQSSSSFVQTIGAIGGGSPAIRRPGVRRMGREFSKGQLDLQPLENQATSVNSEGRGGY